MVPHPAYRLGFGRLSCLKCILGGPNQWASLRAIDPDGFQTLEAYERQFGRMMKREGPLGQLAGRGRPYAALAAPDQADALRQALQTRYDGPVRVPPEEWVLPAGAFGESIGPS